MGDGRWIVAGVYGGAGTESTRLWIQILTETHARASRGGGPRPPFFRLFFAVLYNFSACARSASSSLFSPWYRSMASRPIFWSTLLVIPARYWMCAVRPGEL
jgi:hypothetical protein